MDAATMAAAKAMAGNQQGGGISSQQATQMQGQQKKQQQYEEQKKQMLVQCLAPEAREVSFQIVCVCPCTKSTPIHAVQWCPLQCTFFPADGVPLFLLSLFLLSSAFFLLFKSAVRHNWLSFTSLLVNDPFQRLATIRLVKPEKASGIEMRILQMAQKGQLRGQVSEGQLISMMEQLSEKAAENSKITFQRRKVAGWSDSEDDDDSDLL